MNKVVPTAAASDTPLTPEAAAIVNRKWRDSAAALRETACTLRSCGISFLRLGVQPTEYVQMMSLPAVRSVSGFSKSIVRLLRVMVDSRK